MTKFMDCVELEAHIKSQKSMIVRTSIYFGAILAIGFVCGSWWFTLWGFGLAFLNLHEIYCTLRNQRTLLILRIAQRALDRGEIATRWLAHVTELGRAYPVPMFGPNCL